MVPTPNSIKVVLATTLKLSEKQNLSDDISLVAEVVTISILAMVPAGKFKGVV